MLLVTLRVSLCVFLLGTVLGAPSDRQVRQVAAGANEAAAIITTIQGGESRPAIENQTTIDSADPPAKVREAEHDPDHPQADQPGDILGSSAAAIAGQSSEHATDSPVKVREAEHDPDHPQSDQPDKPSEVVAKAGQDGHATGSSGNVEKHVTDSGDSVKSNQLQAASGSSGSSASHAVAAQDTKHSTDLTASSSGALSSQTIAGSPVGVKTKRDVTQQNGPVGSSSGVGGNTHSSADATHEHNKDPDSQKSAQENFFKSGDVSKSGAKFPPREG